MTKPLKAKVTVSVDAALVGYLDDLVLGAAYENRSVAMEAAIAALHREHMEAQLEAALVSLGSESVTDGARLAEAGVDEWFAELDALDGGYGSDGGGSVHGGGHAAETR